jgi:hypothetical protein
MLAGFLMCIFLPALAHAQGGVLQYGPVNTGHPAMWFGNGAIGDGGSPQGGPVGALGLTGVGVTNSAAQGICTNSGPVTAAYAQLCLGFNNGVPQITLGGYPTPAALQFLVNGTIYTIPGANCTGCGSMSAQNSSSVSISGGNIAGVNLSGVTDTGGTFNSPIISGATITSPTISNPSLTSTLTNTSTTAALIPAYGFLHINVNGTDMRIPMFSPTQAGG